MKNSELQKKICPVRYYFILLKRKMQIFNNNVNHFNGLDRSLLVKHLVIEDIYNSWLYCITNPFELWTCVSLSQIVSNIKMNSLAVQKYLIKHEMFAKIRNIHSS